MKQCDALPVPPCSFLEPQAPGDFLLLKLRRYVWLYGDGAYLSLIILKDRRLVLIDFPDSAGSNTDTGSGTLLTDAIDQVLVETIPNRIDMVYSHAHFDHIGGAARVFRYARKKFADARFFVWGTLETKELIDIHTTKRAVKVTKVVGKMGRTLELGRDLRIKLMIVGGHTQEDLVIFIPKASKQKGIAFYVDVVFPRWSMPFNLAITQDVREMIQAQKEILKLDFDILVPGHLRTGGKRDIRTNNAYVESLLKVSKRALSSVTPEHLADAGIGKTLDPNAREHRNLFYAFSVSRGLEIDKCYRVMIEKWGCKLAGLDLFLRGHCFVAITFALTDI